MKTNEVSQGVKGQGRRQEGRSEVRRSGQTGRHQACAETWKGQSH